ncbi:MAG: cytidylate kinase family protein [Candidatus Kryptoniota bacterium]
MSIITVSRGTFSGGNDLAQCLAKKLGYKALSREILVEAAGKYGISESDLSNAIMAKPAIAERLSLKIDRIRYLSFIQATLCEHVKDDNLVYYGHAGHLLLKNVCRVIKVRVNAPMDMRISFAMERMKLSKKQAVSYINRMDKYREKWTRFLYGVDWNDPSLYDVVLNLKDTSIETACNMISIMAEAPEFQLTEESKRALADLAVESKIKAKLASDSKTGNYLLKIEVRDGNVRISGRVKNINDTNRIRDILSDIPGVKSLDCSCIEYYLNDDIIL